MMKSAYSGINDTVHVVISENNATKPSVFYNDISESAKTAVCLAGILFIVMGLCGNVLVVWVIYRVERLRAIYNLFIVNLMVVDTILLGYLLPFNMVTYISGYFPLGNVLCIFNGVVSNICFPTAILTLMNIAIDRYIIVCHYRTHDKIYTGKRTALIISSTWLMGPLISIPALFGVFDFGYDPVIRTCLFSRYKSKVYTLVFLILGICIPVTAIFICYVKVFVYLRKAKKSLVKSWNNGLTRKRFLENIRITYSLCALFILHMIFYLPFGIVSMFGNGGFVFPQELHHAANFLCFANSGVNSILYGILNSNIRTAIINCFCCEPKFNKVNPDTENKLTPQTNHKITSNSKIQWIKVTASRQELVVINPLHGKTV